MSVSTGVDPTAYLELYFGPQSVHVIKEFALEQVHHFFSTHHLTSHGNVTGYKVLDYGCGPVVAYCISAARLPNVEIVLAEYSSSCRFALMEWMNRAPSPWDWQPCIKHVVQDFERRDEREALEREKTLRKSIKSVVACDITKDPPIAEGYDEPYDVVMSFLSIECGCLTRDDYRAAVKRMSNLVKSGGNYLLHTTIRNRKEHDLTPGFYTIGGTKHLEVALPLQFVLMTLEENGFIVIETNMLPENGRAALCSEYGRVSDLESTAFIIAKKV